MAHPPDPDGHVSPVHEDGARPLVGPMDTEAQDRRDMTRLAAGHGAALNNLMERHAE